MQRFLVFLLLIGFAATFPKRQNNDGCVCAQMECDCCKTIPNIQASVCLDTVWDPTKQTLTASATFGGLNVGQAVFSNTHNSECLDIFGGSLCIVANNLSIITTGACGCWDVSVNLFGVKIDVMLGCFAFGYGATCPGASCVQRTSKGCVYCDYALNCGWCNSTKLCMEGDTNGPYAPSGKCDSGWLYHESQC